MINNKELRIGNYVLVDNLLREVCSVQHSGSAGATSRIGFEINNTLEFELANAARVRAVPITNQLLENLGFVFQTYFKVWQHTRPARSYTIELDNDYCALDFSHQPIVMNMQYVHQLQNLFFFIQGQELLLNSTRATAV